MPESTLAPGGGGPAGHLCAEDDDAADTVPSGTVSPVRTKGGGVLRSGQGGLRVGEADFPPGAAGRTNERRVVGVEGARPKHKGGVSSSGQRRQRRSHGSGEGVRTFGLGGPGGAVACHGEAGGGAWVAADARVSVGGGAEVAADAEPADGALARGGRRGRGGHRRAGWRRRSAHR